MSVVFVTQDLAFMDAVRRVIDAKYTPIFFQPEEGMVDTILGIDTGHFHAELVVMDSDRIAADVITSFIGAGIPVFIRVTTIDIPSLWVGAALGALLFRIEEMNGDFAEALATRKYTQETLEVENEFAEVYDREELSSAATLSAILWENEYTISRVKEYIEKQDGPVRILDMGCGTGRIEEILLSDPTLAKSIESIHAIDFAPMYLKKARERLSHFLSKDLLDRIIFMRRIAEDTRLPAGYFDIVIASFGVICFSQFHRTVPEIYRVLKPSGTVILNGYNRNALAHDFNQSIDEGAKSLFTAHIDRGKNEMHLGDKVIPCFSFDVDELHAFLKLIGLTPQSEQTQTFPTLYGCARKEYLQLLQPLTQMAEAGPVSYQSSRLEQDFFKSGFSSVMHKIDMDLTKSLKNRGFYFSMTATK